MTAPEQQATDPRQPAWDAVFAYIRTLSRDALPGSIVERNAVIWRAVNAALVALGYPDADTQQAAPEQADLRQRIATALRDAAYDCDGHCGLDETECMNQHPITVAVEHHGVATDVYGPITALAEVAAAVLQPELAALREQLAAAEQHVDELQEKLLSFDDNGKCCCSFEGPGDVCLVHSPTVARLRALLAHDHAAAYHQGEPRDGLLWNCGRDSCTAPAARPSV